MMPSEAEIRAALERVLGSPVFLAAPQLSSFLRFVVEETLAGQADRIKGYSVAVGALGRDDTFDPQTNPIVRVEAGRLRRALKNYYPGPGCSDDIVIELPVGSYIPTFRRRVVASRFLGGCVRPLHAALERFRGGLLAASSAAATSATLILVGAPAGEPIGDGITSMNTYWMAAVLLSVVAMISSVLAWSISRN